LAAGTGTRFGALCQEVPKALLPCAGDTLVGRLIDTLLAAGIDEIRVGIGWKGRHIRRAIGSRYKSCRVVCIDVSDYEFGPLQTLVSTVDDTGGDTLVCPVDFVVDSDVVVGLLKSASSLADEQVTLAYDDGVLNGTPLTVDSDNRVICVGEGAVRSAMMVVAGTSFLNYCKEALAAGANRILQVMEHMLSDGQAVRAYRVEGYWHDIDTIPDLLSANRHLLKQQLSGHGGLLISEDDVVDSGELVANDLGIKIGSGTRLRGPCLISPKCEIAPNSIVGPNVYMDRETLVDDQCTITDAILFDRARINQGTKISSVVVRRERIYSG
jgi:NDP-sugar pyrophosphorylase family protein